MVSISEYLFEASHRRWKWGGGKEGFEGDDCTLFVANWALALTGTDPGVGLRGSYSTDYEAMAIIARAGGFPAFIDQQLRPQGWARIAGEPKDGDIAVVLAPLPPAGAFGPVPAIRAEGKWIGRSMRGQVARNFRAISIWRWKAAPMMDLGPPAPAFNGMLPTPMQMFGGTALTPIPSQMQQTGILEGFILAGLTTAGVSASVSAFVAPLLAGVAATGISLAVNSLFAPDVPKPPEPEDGRVPILQSLPPVIYAVGRNRISGYAMLHEAKSDRLYMVNALVGHRIEGLVDLYLHEDKVTIDEDPNPHYPSMMSVEEGTDGRYGEQRIAFDYRLGLPTETAYGDFVTALTGEGVYTSSYRGDDTASLAIGCRAPSLDTQQKIFPYGVPQASVVLDCARVWDWRDEAQDPDDPTTWEYSRNAVLLMVWHYCFNPYYGPYDYTEAVLPNIDRLTEEADICDEPVDLAAGGEEPRYEANIWTTTDKDPKGFANAILNAGDIWFSHRGDGSLDIIAGKFREELVETITDDDITGYFLQNDVEEENEVNQLIPKFVYPATDYTNTDADAFDDIDSQLIFGIQRADCDLQAVQSWRQARRLAKREWLRLQMKRRGSLDLNLSGINAAYARWVRIESTRYPRLNGMLIENRRSVVSFTDGVFSMEFIEHPEDIDAWDPETDEGNAPPVPNGAVSGDIETATIDNIAVMAGSKGAFFRVAIVEPISDSLIPIMRIRLADGPGQWIEQSFPDAEPDAGLIILDTNPVIGDEDYEIQVGFRATKGTKSAWMPEPPLEESATIDTVAPDDLLSFSASDGVGQFTVNFSAANDPHLSRVAIYKVPSGGSLVRATHEISRPFVAAGNYNLPFSSGTGNFDIYVEPLNVSGIAGTLEGPDAVTVT